MKPIQLQPDIELRDSLGEGATSIVYRATVTKDKPYAKAGTEVAIKLFRTQPIGKDLGRFNREFSIGKKLRTTCVARYYAKGLYRTAFDNRPYLIMEFIQGDSLSNAVKQIIALSPKGRRTRLVQLISGALQALAILADNDIVHRDIQANNILVRNGQPVLLDLGTSKYFSAPANFTSAWEEVGTRRYWAPECLETNADRWTSKTDVFMLGSCLFHLLTGQYLFSDAINYPQFFSKLSEFGKYGDKGYGPPSVEMDKLPDYGRQLFIDLMLWPAPKFRPAPSELLAIQTSQRVEELKPLESNRFPLSYFMWDIALEDSEAILKLLEDTERKARSISRQLTIGDLQSNYRGGDWMFSSLLGMLFSFGLFSQTDPKQIAYVSYRDETVISSDCVIVPSVYFGRVLREIREHHQTLKRIQEVHDELSRMYRESGHANTIGGEGVQQLGYNYYVFKTSVPHNPLYSIAVHSKRVNPTYICDVRLVPQPLTWTSGG